MAWERSVLRPATANLKVACVSRAHVTERGSRHDKACQGSSSLEKDDRCNAGTSSLGSIFGRYAEGKFTERRQDTPDPRSALSLYDPSSPACPWRFGRFVRVLAQSSNHLLELAKLCCEPWHINGLMSFSRVALYNT